ncbi:MAG: glutamate carboxypeptidase [Acidobacteria bacterium]|nr:MAG: glutamate carboxypeptidase [Acidobacteriota bacterium]
MKKTLPTKMLRVCTLLVALAIVSLAQQQAHSTSKPLPISGFRDAAAEQKLEEKFLAVPDPRLAREHLQVLSSEPHMAGSTEDRNTAEYVAKKFREAGLETRIDAYRVWINLPKEILVEATAPAGLKMRGPAREHVDGDPFQDDPRVVIPFNSGSASGEVEAELVYANYARPEDFRKLKQMGIDVRGKIVIARYGQNFRGVKALAAQENGAAALILYSDPIDDGYFHGDPYPKGPYRPPTGVQRGAVEFTFEYPGDPTTPGFASTPDLPESQRLAPEKAGNLTKIPVTPLSYADVAPLLEKLGGPESPREWQGALPFTYHVGSGPVRVHVKLVQNYSYTTVWNVIGTITGTAQPEALVIAGNHRDAWVYGAADPVSGTAAMLEAIHGLGELLKSGWRPQRSIIFASWDAEEQGLIGSTEYAEQFAKDLRNAVAYFNMDIGVAGPDFRASSVPSLKQFLRDLTHVVPSPKGLSVYDAWRLQSEKVLRRSKSTAECSSADCCGEADRGDVRLSDLGSGSDYSAFLQHLGVPSTDIGSIGPYGVYHSVFDNYAWFAKFADPSFVYEQQMARIFGLEVLRMAQADALPFDYETYGTEIRRHLETAKCRAQELRWNGKPDFAVSLRAADRLAAAGRAAHRAADAASGLELRRLNSAFLEAERALLGKGLPRRPWFRHTIYAPGEYTGYAAVVIPGVNESMDRNDSAAASEALDEVTAALERASAVLESAL